jgi:hypothetical protein
MMTALQACAARAYTLMMQSLGQTALQACSGLPAHSSHFAGSISKIESPWLIPWLVHSGSHAPQLMHSSVILFAIEKYSWWGSFRSIRYPGSHLGRHLLTEPHGLVKNF